MSEQVEDGMGFSGFIPQKGDAEYRPCRVRVPNRTKHTPVDIVEQLRMCGDSISLHAAAEICSLRRNKSVNADLLAACEAAREAMTNKRYRVPRLGMEKQHAMCEAAIAKAREAQ